MRIPITLEGESLTENVHDVKTQELIASTAKTIATTEVSVSFPATAEAG